MKQRTVQRIGERNQGPLVSVNPERPEPRSMSTFTHPQHLVDSVGQRQKVLELPARRRANATTVDKIEGKPVNEALDSGDQSEGLDGQRSGPGILVFTSTLQLLQMNTRALELSRRINLAQSGSLAGGVLPAAVTELCGEIRKMLESWIEPKDWEQVEVKRLAGDVERPVLLRGFGLPDWGGQQPRILVIMEERHHQDRATSGLVMQRFQLTPREQSVIEHLVKGWTNKQIAQALGITEQTVKEHFKHILEKTKTTTRTGLLVKLFLSPGRTGHPGRLQPEPIEACEPIDSTSRLSSMMALDS
jgi:DNA-binding CsgD family transcriptional regulator